MGANWPSTFKRWVSGSGTWSRVGCFFNSALSTAEVTPSTNASLTIYLRVQLVERNAKDAHLIRGAKPGQTNIVRDWDRSSNEFNRFKDEVQKKSAEFWHNKFCLINKSEISTLDVKVGNQTLRPNINCGFEIVWVDSPSSAHQVVNCYCPNLGKDFPSFVRGSSTGNGAAQFANKLVNITTTSVPDARSCLKPEGDPLVPEKLKYVRGRCPLDIDHLGIAHEVGHMIGLPHVGVYRQDHDCLAAIEADPTDGVNHPKCYTGPGMGAAMNIMGIGNVVAEWNALPWLVRLFEHTGLGPDYWKVSLDKPNPQVL